MVLENRRYKFNTIQFGPRHGNNNRSNDNVLSILRNPSLYIQKRVYVLNTNNSSLQSIKKKYLKPFKIQLVPIFRNIDHANRLIEFYIQQTEKHTLSDKANFHPCTA